MPDEKPPETRLQTDCLPHTSAQTERCSILRASKPPWSSAYEQGLQVGLATKATGPNA